jgi:hypothetical protein
LAAYLSLWRSLKPSGSTAQLFVAAHESVPGPLLPRAHAPTCLHLAKADIRALGTGAGRYGTRTVSGFPFSNILNVTTFAGAEFSETFTCVGCSKSSSPL